MKYLLLVVSIISSLGAMNTAEKFITLYPDVAKKLSSLDTIERDAIAKLLQQHPDIIGLKNILPIPSRGLPCKGPGMCTRNGAFLLDLEGSNITVTSLSTQDVIVLAGHRGPVRSVTIQEDRCASAGDTTARVWDLSTGTCVRILDHDAEVVKVFINEDATLLHSLTCEYLLHIWDLETGILQRTIPVKCNAKELMIVSSVEDHAVIASDNHHLCIWHGAELLMTEEGHDEEILSLAYDSSQQRFITASRDGTARIWEADGTCVSVLTGHEGPVVMARFDGFGSFVITASADGTAKVWQLDGSCLYTYAGHEGPLVDAQLSADCSWVLTAARDTHAVLWCTEGALPLLLLKDVSSTVFEVGFINGKPYMLCTDGSGLLWDVDAVLSCIELLSVEQMLFICAVLRKVRHDERFTNVAAEEILKWGFLFGSTKSRFSLKGHPDAQTCFEELPAPVREQLEPFVEENIGWILQKLRDLRACFCGQKRVKYKIH